MSPQLKLAADSLVARLKVFGPDLPSPKTRAEDWKELVAFYGGAFPNDYVELMTQYPFDDVVLEHACRNPVRKYPEYLDTVFWFAQPSPQPSESWHPDLSKMGWFPVGGGEDGDFWAVRIEHGLEGPVYWVEHTAWDGGPLTFRNGLTWAAESLAKLIAGFSFRELRVGDWDSKRLQHEFDLRSDLFDPGSSDYDFEKTVEGT